MSQYEDNYATAKMPGSTSEEAGPPTPNPLLVAHSLLRGRYVLAIFLALVGGAAGGVAGYYAKKPTYESAGAIRIKPIITGPRGDRAMPAYVAFIKTQEAFLSSERVVTKAMEMADWQALVPGLAPEAIAGFRKNLQVTWDQGELIRIAFEHESPAIAQAAVKCVIESYLEIYGKSEYDNGGDLLDTWRAVRTKRQNELRVKKEAIAAIAGTDMDPDTFEKHYQQVMQVTNANWTAWKDYQRLVAESVPEPADGPDEQPSTQPSEMTLAQIAASDARMQHFLAEKRNAERDLALARARFLPRHSTVIEAEHRLKLATEDVERYADEYRERAPLAPPRAGEPVPKNLGDRVIHEMRLKEANLKRLYDDSEAYRRKLGEKIVILNSLKSEADTIRQHLDEATAAIQELELDAASGGRISAISTGERPVVPHKDKRMQLAFGGTFGGAALGLGLVLGVGLLNRRLVSVDDARLGLHRLDRVLGVLPHVPDNLADTEQAAVAAHCVHHIRTLLQLEPGLPPRRVYALTSPSPGDGKTTLTIALGMSYAASGARTLLLDCDIIGGGLSSKMDQMIRPRIGRVLRREGLLTDEQLQQAVGVAKQTGKRIGEVLVGLGFVSEADVAHAVAVQAQSYVGLLDVLGGEPLADCITGTGRPGLFILPLGSAGAHHAGQLSPTSLQRILSEARASFDVVLVDTGPILGSLEAAMVAAQSDSVVLAISRGVPQALVKRSLDRLLEVGANVVGMVLNRAAAREVASFAFSSGSLRASKRLPAPTAGAQRAPEIRLDAVRNAVASSGQEAM